MKEAIRDLGGERKSHRALEEQIERLENEQRELKARLAKLEAKAPELPPTEEAPVREKRPGKKKPA